ncbi:MAG: 6-bladed beta-propeller [Candidatus Aminicenantes bacterium]|nr:6-bladed beta-propeller [Candidatus Aminicenantes bacterium]NIM79169.1 6-bladed beta-propeller [Candidatus Aminicenantes bacterium]NIN18454.1 6-bladed beta-propeller [Candidatus Aminicenantes bacterium]NIN42342.1 6-bladed beta-propeller [Candidatus Aminicenantes bacterium]NIN85108.1 6-bladed beta-propeller [Candidatus Aminicenantes bacterium]
MKRIAVVIFLFSCVLYVFPGKLSVLPELRRPHSLVIAGGELYVVDGVEVYIYSLSDYQLLRKFGKKGEGPGEFLPSREIPIQLQFFKDFLVLNSTTKIAYFTKQGKLVKEKNIPFTFTQILPFGNNYGVVKFTATQNHAQTYSVILYDANFREIKKLYSSTRPRPSQAERGIKIPKLIYIGSTGNKLFVVDQKDDSYIRVFDLSGKPLKPIKTNLPRLKVDESIKKEFLEWFQTSKFYKIFGVRVEELKRVLHFPEYLPAIRIFRLKGGIFYIQTYKTKDNNQSEFIFLDINGNQLNRIYLPSGEMRKVQIGTHMPYSFVRGRYYYLVENVDSEEWELHMKEVPLKKN